MLRSMTGFGSAKGKADGVEYDVEIRAVNHRYFKASIKLPEAWSSAETDVEARLRRDIQRGSVTVSVRMKVADEQAAYHVNMAALARYVDQLRELEVDGNLTMRIDLGSLLQLPGVCEPPALEDLCVKTHAALMALIDEAVKGLIAMRQREGEALQTDLLANCDMIDEHLASVAERSPLVVSDYHERLHQRVAELAEAGKISLDADVLTREVAIFAERCDVAEEINRLGGHLDQFRKTVNSSEASGRKLDFIAQELLREANTIGSKANDTEIARAVVDIKTAVDRIKEQVQNVE